MTFAATEAALSADLSPRQGVESCLLRHMARAHHVSETCFERAEEAGDRRAAELRLAERMIAIFSRALAAFDRRRARRRGEAEAAREEQHAARFDHALHLAALADAAVGRKAKREAAGAAVAQAAGPQGDGTADGTASRPLSRQQRRAAERRLRKAGAAQGP